METLVQSHWTPTPANTLDCCVTEIRNQHLSGDQFLQLTVDVHERQKFRFVIITHKLPAQSTLWMAKAN